MRRFTSTLCLAAGMAWAIAAAAQTPQGQTGGTQATVAADKTVTVIGCLEPGTTSSFVLNVVDESVGGTLTARPQSGQETTGVAGTAGMTFAGQRLELVGGARADVRTHVGHKVEITGRMVPQGVTRGREAGQPASMKLDVRAVKHLADTCVAAPGVSGTTGVTPAKPGTMQSPTTAPPTPPSATPTQAPNTAITGAAMLSGLVNLNVQEVLANVSASANLQNAAVNVSDVLNDVQVAALVQALNTNPTAKATADKLTLALQERGVLQPTERMVGFSNGVIYKAGTTPQ